ncbi:MAG: transcriptional repressor [Clostridia bacterium]|nr:transcriptional repressor [Clostridia bacterium]
MPKYHTKQREILTDLFKRHPDEQLSAKDIVLLLDGGKISISAVYRNLALLEKDGVLKRFTKNGSRDVYYQYTDNEHCKNRLHLSCKKCGQTFHMNINSAVELIDTVQKTDGFILDKSETVLYGICKKCINN